MKALGTFELMRVWASLTGLAAAACFLFEWLLGMASGGTLPMLVAAIGGFEMVLYAQDLWTRRKHRG